MKTKITLLLIIFFSIISNGQTPINGFFDVNGAVYDIVTSTPDFDQSMSGENVVWNFNQLVLVGGSTSYNSIPTVDQITTFPNSTSLNQVYINVGNIATNNQIFYTNIANEISITGFKTPELELNYVSNNAKIGTFPLAYGYDFTDTTAGTFISGANNGTFSGNIITSVDAYGTLTLNDTGNGSFSGAVTRLKTVQNINLTIGFLPVGTMVQTTYNYIGEVGYSELRYTKAVVNIPLLNITNQTVTQIEDFVTTLLSTNKENEFINKFKIYPNPVNDILNIKTDNNQNIIALHLSDINGREIINQTSDFENFDIRELQNGIYFLKIDTDKGSFAEKIIKN